MGAGCSSEHGVATNAAPVAKAASVKSQPAAEATTPSPAGTPPAASQPSRASVDDFLEEEDTPAKRDPEARLEALHRCFDALDKDKSGTIDFKELKQYLFKTGVNISLITGKAEELMAKMDLNSDNLISRDEFTHMMEALLVGKTDEDLEVWVAEVVFTATSRNVVGFGDSLGEVLSGLDLTTEQVSTLKDCFKQLDRNSSGFVELPEVKALLGRSGMDMEHVSEELNTIMLKLDKHKQSRKDKQ
ncbi:hypothetical protein HYH02_003706 [Chlamydomonas schloesseri]|uniref:EF-hand domain-containing protein n=1 Tax=Chlamydomonas schloesseri TaxID=2026947 RepID=A0A835WQB2_9CHLO|nr:hypothetical protein HYH02_003706 [Chlamydomonas schloesseri]|eukprot:KAG2451932.1 hypothetical protein HYH02_003706 [Chlamydomonas schloesseri]